VEIADTPSDFVLAVSACLRGDSERQRRADAFLSTMSWDATFARMKALLDECVHRHRPVRSAMRPAEASADV